MSTEAISAYSATNVYGQLTSPFTPKTVTINAHTPYDKVDEGESAAVVSRNSFYARPKTSLVYDELPESQITFNPDDYTPITIGSEDTSNKTSAKTAFPPESSTTANITGFSASSASSNDIVQQSLKQGYTTEQAIALKNAQNSYKNSSVLTKDPVGALSTVSYRVS